MLSKYGLCRAWKVPRVKFGPLAWFPGLMGPWECYTWLSESPVWGKMFRIGLECLIPCKLYYPQCSLPADLYIRAYYRPSLKWVLTGARLTPLLWSYVLPRQMIWRPNTHSNLLDWDQNFPFDITLNPYLAEFIKHTIHLNLLSFFMNQCSEISPGFHIFPNKSGSNPGWRNIWVTCIVSCKINDICQATWTETQARLPGQKHMTCYLVRNTRHATWSETQAMLPGQKHRSGS